MFCCMCRWIRTRAIYNPSTNRFFLTCSAVNHNFGGSLGGLSIDPKADGAQKMVQAIQACTMRKRSSKAER